MELYLGDCKILQLEHSIHISQCKIITIFAITPPRVYSIIVLNIYITIISQVIHLFQLSLLRRRKMHDPCFIAGGALL